MSRARNDPGQYEELADSWWDPRGPFAMLGWLAEHRAGLVPPASAPGALLLDLACGGGLLAPHLAGRGFRHVGVDTSPTAVRIAAAHGVTAVQADVLRLPFPDSCAEVVVAGEVLEHVPGPERLVAEISRVLAPGGTLVLDTIADTRLARLVAITLSERLPGGPPRGLHDPALLVDRAALLRSCAEHGIALRLTGLRPSAVGYLLWLAGRRERVAIGTFGLTSVLFAGVGTLVNEQSGG